MRTIRALTFFADGDGFAVDVDLVHKIARKMKITPVPAAPCEVTGIANIRGKVVTILSVTALLKRKQNAGTRHYGTGTVPRTVNAVVFKPSGRGDQMGLIMDRPGGLVEIDDSKTTPLPLTEEAARHISGVSESGGIFYRIINIESIIGDFMDGGDYSAVSESRGGTVNEENL